eukprot:3060665-Lingulodinium_polyedra.AAC.1
MEEDNSLKMSYNKRLLSGTKEKKASISACKAYAVDSNRETSLGGLEAKTKMSTASEDFAKKNLTGQ